MNGENFAVSGGSSTAGAKTPPFSLEAEQAALGSLIYVPNLFSSRAGEMSADLFYVGVHARLYALLERLFLAGEKIEPVRLIEMSKDGKIFDTDDTAKSFLLALDALKVEVNSFDVYLGILKNHLLSRKISSLCDELSGLIYARAEPEGVLELAETRLAEIRSGKATDGLEHIGASIADRLARLGNLISGKNVEDRGISTGFRHLDFYIHGLSPSNLIVLAARPRVGKTTFAVNIALEVARKNPQKKVVMFSLEMSKAELADRMIASLGFFTQDQLKTGEGIPDRVMREEPVNIQNLFDNMGFFATDNPLVTVAEMKSQLKRMNNISLVVIDYLQLMSTSRKDNNRVQEIAEISRGLKIMAKELVVPIIVLSQLSRASESRTDKRPMLSDLRDSGAIEQDADSVMFLHREVLYDPAVENPNDAELIIAKNRHGAQGTIHLNFDGQYSRFTSVETDN